MKVRIKREQLKKWGVGFTRASFWKKEDFFILPEEFELEISEADIVKEKSNREKWEEVFNLVDKFLAGSNRKDLIAEIANKFSQWGYFADKAYEKIVEGK